MGPLRTNPIRARTVCEPPDLPHPADHPPPPRHSGVWRPAVKRALTPYFAMWGLGLSNANYTFTQDWPPWPANDEDKQAILSIGSEASNSRYGISQEAYANPEDVKTRRQLRVRPTLRKSKADDK